MTKGPILFVALVLLACAGVFMFTKEATAPTINTLERPQDQSYQEEAYKNRVTDIGTYVRTNISALSPVQEALGGTFYVIDVSAQNGIGVVKYEDGHMQYTADFTYTTSDNGYTITKFKVRK